MQQLRALGIQTSIHYPPVHLFSLYREKFGYEKGMLPKTEEASRREITLPLHPGMKVNVYTDLHPDKPFAGQIGYISPRAEFTPKNVETRELRSTLVYRLRVVVEDADESLRQGMPVTVKLMGEK